ncbi:MAG TPA: EAL domain-containing protein [Gammaproteobacteria bacterium]|nr:EAL domain-containing protein [Gammaproteobacteria bacterium]
MTRRELLIALATAAAVLALVLALYRGGLLDRLEHAVAETRAEVLSRTVDSDIVIVGIDAHSLEELGVWPWPRGYHARLLQHLKRTTPELVFFDIDFSSLSPNADDDDRLERELVAFDRSPVLLASHVQASQGSSTGVTARRPLPRFRGSTREVSVVLETDSDGLVRKMRASTDIAGTRIPSAFALSGGLPEDAVVSIDFSIDPGSFDYVSYSDLLNAEIDLAALDGKKVFVGATSSELGDSVPVPRFQRLPGVVVQAMVFESITLGTLRAPPAWLFSGALALWAVLLSVAFSLGTWRRNSIVGAASLVLLVAATILVYGRLRIELDIVPFFLASALVFVVSALRSLDRQTWRAMAFAIGVRRRDALLKSVIETSMDAIVCVDSNGVIRTANPAAASLFSLPLRDLLGAEVSRFIRNLEGDLAGLAQRASTSELIGADSSGREFPVEATLSRVAFDDGTLFTMIVRDISERKAQQRELEYQARHDSLTALPNRAAVMSYLETILGTPGRDFRVAVLMLDLCRFKEINDTLGHDVGDEVLQVVGRRFAMALGEGPFIGRIGGDEFCAIVPEVSRRSAIETLAQNLAESLKEPIPVRGIAVEVGLSIGIAFYPEHAANAQELLRHSDVAMYAAKRRNSPCEYYSRDDDCHSVRRLSMVSDLRSAIALNDIELLFQPQIDLRTGALAGAEALLRWEHPVHGPVSPLEFVAIAESTDLIQPLTEWTICEALRRFVLWEQNGFATRVAVNLSARSLQDVEFPHQLEHLLSRFGVQGRWLELEITETAMMLDPRRALEVIRDVQALGVRVTIDDFGTGYSSLGYIRDLKAHALKLDKSFVIDLERHEHNRAIVESTAHMTAALGLEVVAEGVETEWVSSYLAQVGYSIGQGYWFGRPMPADALFERYRSPDDAPEPAAAMTA